MLKAVAPVLLVLAIVATPAAAVGDPNSCQYVGAGPVGPAPELGTKICRLS